MNDIELKQALQMVERPTALPAEFTDSVFRAMVAELESETAPDRAAVVAPRPPIVRVRQAWTWRPMWRPVVAIAAVVALVVAATVTLSVREAPSALAALQDARQRFEEMPAYHARTTVTANDDSSDPDFELQWQTEDWFQDRNNWRTTFLSSTSASTNSEGDFAVMTPDLHGDYDANTSVLRVRPSSEVDPSANPSFFLDPSLQWWSDGSIGDMGKPSDQFFEENCSVTSGTFAGRASTRVDCPAKPKDLEIWLDDATGMILRLAAFDIVREIDSIEIDPTFPAGIFKVVAPEGAKTRWGGDGPPPAEYDVPVGTEVSARHKIAEGRTDGLGIQAVVGNDIWILRHDRCAQPCAASLIRVDARTGSVLATIDPPEDLRFDDMVVAGDELWVALTRWDGQSPTTPAWIQRLDPATNTLVGDRIETGTSSGGMAWIDGDLWTSSGAARFVKIGRAESYYNAVARVDVRTGQVQQFDVDAGAIGRPIGVGNEVWVVTDKINPNDIYEQVFEFVALDKNTGTVTRRMRIPGGWPYSPVVDGGRIYVLAAEAGKAPQLFAIDAASATVVATEPLGPPDTQIGSMALSAGHLWVVNTTDGSVMKIDPATLKPVATIATGLDPTDVAFGAGSVWVVNSGDGTLVRIDLE